MEYVNLVNQIVAAEHSAKEIGKEIQMRQETLASDLAKESAQLREDYFARAERRVNLVEESERAAAQEDMSRSDQRLEESMAKVEASYRKNRDAWVEALFQRVVSDHA